MSFSVSNQTIVSLRPYWNNILSRSLGGNVFSSWEFQNTWHDTLGHCTESVNLAVYDDSRLVGIAPFIHKDDMLSFAGGEDVSDYLDVLIEAGLEEPVWAALLEHLSSLPWEHLDLFSLRSGSPTFTHLPNAARERGWQVELSEQDVCPLVQLPGDWEGYLAGLNKKDRHELRRKVRRLESDSTARFFLGTNLTSDIEKFVELHRVSAEAKAGFMTDAMAEFFLRIAQEFDRKRQYGMYFISLGDEVVSAAMCFYTPSELLLYNSGFRRDYGYLSVGLLTKAYCLRDAIDRGLPVFNFLRGREPYKYHLGGQDELVYRMIVRR